MGRFCVMFIGQFQKAIIYVISAEGGFCVLVGQHQSGLSYALWLRVACEKMIAGDDVTRPVHDPEMRPEHHAVVSDLVVIAVDVEGDHRAVLRIKRLLRAAELAMIDPHPLTPLTDGGDSPVAGAVEIAIHKAHDPPVFGQHHRRAAPPTAEFDIVHLKIAQPGEAGEIQHVLVALEGELLRARAAMKRLTERDAVGACVACTHIDLAPHAYATDP